MGIRIRHVAAALVLLSAGAQGAAAAETRTWYVYCEGAGPDGHWAILSENLWPHPASADYGRRVGSAAKAFLEARYDLALEGCAGVNFGDDSLAAHSRTLTVQLHRRMGDRVYFFPLPAEILRADAAAPAVPRDALVAVDGISADRISADQVSAGAPETGARGWGPPTAPR
jgi:hypothetical protein